MNLSEVASPELLFASANASVHFALACLEPVPADPAGSGGHLRAKSTFVDAQSTVMHWHDFGDLEGPGWAANAIGGADLIYRWGRYAGDETICEQALQLVDHILDDGFVRDDGFVWPYWDLARQRFCLNYAHTDDWLCPGSLAKVGVQMLELAEALGDTLRADRLRAAARGLGAWLAEHVELLPNGWVPRRVTPEGAAYALSPEGGTDSMFEQSADGLFLLDLWLRLGETDRARALGDIFIAAGGLWGSINHDTYDSHENVAYAVAFRVLRSAADVLDLPHWREFAYDVALPAMAVYRMPRDEHGVTTRGLFWMEKSWDTAYLWENAEVAQAHLEAWLERHDGAARDAALQTLSALAHHHSGDLGFLTEGLDWNNHISQRHHVAFDYYGAIRYTEPLLNNLHLVGPTLTYLMAHSVSPPEDIDLGSSLSMLSTASPLSDASRALETRDGQLLLRLIYPVIATDDGVTSALAFCRDAGIDGVLLFELSYDTDPAMLTLDVLEARFARLKAVVPAFRDAGLSVHINVMITMGHSDGGGAQPEAFDFQYIVDADGHTSRVTACPLDPKFLTYVAQIYRWAAKCGVDAVWVDDDVRFLGHDVTEMTCFCPHHLAAMAARSGHAWTREALVEALADPAHPEARETWLDLQHQAMSGLAETVERAIHTVSPHQEIGLMSVGTTVHNAEGRLTDKLLRTLAGPDTRPMLRPGSGFWHDETPVGVLTKTEDVARQVAYLGRDVRVVAEVENHPYSPYQKSLRMLALEMTLNILAGTHDISLNILPETRPFQAEVDYAAFLCGQRPFLRELGRARAGKRRIGVGVEAREDVARKLPVDGGSLMQWVETRPWELALGRLGLPVGTLYDAPHLISGSTVYTDRYALGSMLEAGSLLTPGAVRGLLAQGWGDQLGILDVAPAAAGVNELITRDPFSGVHGGVCLPVRHYVHDLRPYTFSFAEAANVRVLSTWQDVNGVTQGPATVALETPDGRRVGLLPFELAAVTPALLQPAHRDQWAALAAWVARVPLPVRVLGGMNVVPQVFTARNGAVLLALVNLSFDQVVAHLDAPVLAGAATVERLTPEGHWVIHNDPRAVAVAAWSVTVLRTS